MGVEILWPRVEILYSIWTGGHFPTGVQLLYDTGTSNSLKRKKVPEHQVTVKMRIMSPDHDVIFVKEDLPFGDLQKKTATHSCSCHSSTTRRSRSGCSGCDPDKIETSKKEKKRGAAVFRSSEESCRLTAAADLWSFVMDFKIGLPILWWLIFFTFRECYDDVL